VTNEWGEICGKDPCRPARVSVTQPFFLSGDGGKTKT
jgi:hypothetical protein